MPTYIEYHEDDKGDTVDVSYYDSRACWEADTDDDPTGGLTYPDAIDYPVYCGHCGELVASVGLTDAGVSYVLDHLDTWSPDKVAELIEGYGLGKEARATFYEKYRADHPGLPASSAWHWATSRIEGLASALDPGDWDEHGDEMRMDLERDGFTVVVTAKPDWHYEPIGKFTTQWSPDVVNVPQSFATRPSAFAVDYPYYEPSVSYSYHRRELGKLGHSRHDADTMARGYVRTDMAADGGESFAYGLIVTVSKEDVELGSASVWGFTFWDDGKADMYSRVRQQLADAVSDHGLIEEALSEARVTLAKLTGAAS